MTAAQQSGTASRTTLVPVELAR